MLSIARADANEVLSWGKEQIIRGKGEIKLSTDLSRALSSLKLKAGESGLDVDIKLHDKLKAIELYFKLLGEENRTASDGALYIDYDYVSPNGQVPAGRED